MKKNGFAPAAENTGQIPCRRGFQRYLLAAKCALDARAAGQFWRACDESR
jgi:hypothetical protein